ncbi:hypothetical protein CK203_096516 [Vitis vinifera]|uniref:Uncharacterized protein n=1 Tax=Vitis vinifera TaxID=29760 RepID=A0A438CTW3_VITVI|nr:hypothetical protein CK203_096516 [Vitis vinifera]
MHPGDEEEAEIREMEGGLDPQRDFEQSGPECDIPPPLQTEGVQFEASFPEPMISKSAYTAGPSESFFIEPSHVEIPSQAPHVPDHAPWMDLFAQISSLGTCIEELAIRLGRIEERMDQQHEEMMAYLRSVFPPPPP